jgi:hypothetical protein
MIATKVVHSQSKSAWNVVGTKWGGKYKIAIVPYAPSSHEDVTLLNRHEAYTYAMFISNAFNAQAK